MSVVGFPNAGISPAASSYQLTPSRLASNYVGVDVPEQGRMSRGLLLWCSRVVGRGDPPCGGGHPARRRPRDDNEVREHGPFVAPARLVLAYFPRHRRSHPNELRPIGGVDVDADKRGRGKLGVESETPQWSQA